MPECTIGAYSDSVTTSEPPCGQDADGKAPRPSQPRHHASIANRAGRDSYSARSPWRRSSTACQIGSRQPTRHPRARGPRTRRSAGRRSRSSQRLWPSLPRRPPLASRHCLAVRSSDRLRHLALLTPPCGGLQRPPRKETRDLRVRYVRDQGGSEAACFGDPNQRGLLDSRSDGR